MSYEDYDAFLCPLFCSRRGNCVCVLDLVGVSLSCSVKALLEVL